MAGERTLTSLNVHIGADTEEFQTGMDLTVKQMSAVEEQAGRVKVVLESEIQAPLQVAGATAKIFAGSMTGALQEVGLAYGGLSGGAQSLIKSFGGVLDSSMAAAGNLGLFAGKAVNLSSLTGAAAVATASLGVEFFKAGYAIGTAIDKAEGWSAGAAKMGKATKEYGELLADSEERFLVAAHALDKLTGSLNLTGPEWEFSTHWTAENAKRVAELTDKANALAGTEAKLSGIIQQSTQDAINAAAAFQQHTDAINTSLGVMSESQVKAGMEAAVSTFKLLASEGISAEQVTAAMADQVRHLTEVGEQYGLKTPKSFDRVSEALDGGVAAVRDLEGVMRDDLPKATEVGIGKASETMKGFSWSSRDAVKGGFGLGAEEGVAEIKGAVEKYRGEMEAKPLKIPLAVTKEGFNQTLAELRQEAAAAPPIAINVKLNQQALISQLRELGIDVPNPAGEVPR